MDDQSGLQERGKRLRVEWPVLAYSDSLEYLALPRRAELCRMRDPPLRRFSHGSPFVVSKIALIGEICIHPKLKFQIQGP